MGAVGRTPDGGRNWGGGRERRWGTLDVPHRCRRRRSAPREHPAASGKGRKIKRISPQISGAAPLISGAAPQRFMGRKTRPSRRKTLSSASALLAPSQCTDWGAVGGGFASPAPPAAAGRPPGPTALTFTSLHSRESVKAGNISSYFCTASWRTAPRWGWGRLQDPPPPAPPFPPPTPFPCPPPWR